jgi:hypothetical protein
VRAVVLSAGKASRLGGVNKLLITAGDRPVYEWHRALLEGYRTAVVSRPADAGEIAIRLPWVDRVVGHPEPDGPVGALAAYLDAYPEDEDLLVLYADTLLVPQPLPGGDWVGVAPAPARRWDFPTDRGHWARGVIDVPVCVGIYLPWNRIRGWHDAGDPEALSRVPKWLDAVREDPPLRSVDGTLSVNWRG